MEMGKPLSDYLLSYQDAEHILREVSPQVHLSEAGDNVIMSRQALLEIIAFAYEQGSKDGKELKL